MRMPFWASGPLMLLAASLTLPAAAETPVSPSALISELASKAPLFRSSRTLSSLERQRQLEKLLEEYFDMPRIAKSVLGNFWQGANVANRQKFTKVLRNVMTRTYSDRFTRYSSDSFRVTSHRDLDATNTVVYSDVGDPVLGEQTKVEWHVVRRDGYRIVDVRIAGASLAKVMHDDFGSYLRRNNGDLPNLIGLLQAKLAAEKSN